MSLRNKLVPTLAILSLVASSLPIGICAQETGEADQTKVENKDNGLSYTYEEAAKKVDEDFYDQYLYSLHYYGVTDQMIANLPEGAVREAAIQYLIELPTGGDVSMPYAHFKKLYPSIVSNTQTSTEKNPSSSEDKGLSYTYAEAAEKVDQGFYDEYLYSLHYYGVTDEMLAKLPEGAVREAAIRYLIKLPTGGDITMPYNNFKKLYPEIFSTSDSDPKNQNKDESESSPKYEQLAHHLNNQKEISQDQKETLPLHYTFKTETGEYLIKYISLLAPNSAGNQDEELPMLVVKYEFKNTSNQIVKDYAHNWDEQVFVSQSQEDSTIKLEPGNYQLDPNQQSFPTFEEVKPREETVVTAYYQLQDLESPLNISILEDDAITDFDLQIESLLKHPKQSALYFDESNHGYLFDFNTIYLLNPSQDVADQLGLEIKNLTDFELSEEVEIQIAKTTEPVANAIQIENIHYQVVENDTIEILNDEEEVILALQTESNWETFEDANEQTFQIVQ
ncbi:DUF5067 domain-containing protein [Facklamia miroungae]|uniref:DUF5067 domain-containing protein n=1 Tax=Facklamia miroungae TaxID=120956 RepID=A0A1G7Q972_9LACT|nr:DUF5067 domain-containing protein [Facklamia miroungae]NKZ28864.1 DUF5067 domain-containing protein [Facklamia miroungae]SDF95005.1 protein of unknown function [Facklamia miroungae]